MENLAVAVVLVMGVDLSGVAPRAEDLDRVVKVVAEVRAVKAAARAKIVIKAAKFTMDSRLL